MKKVKILALPLALLALTLAACNTNKPSESKSEETSQSEPTSTSEVPSEEPSEEPSEPESIPEEEKMSGDILKYDRAAYLSTYRGLRINGTGYTAEPFKRVQGETGSYFEVVESKAIVVPVDFTDFPASSLPAGEDGFISDLNNIVFGDSEDTGWESLKSYYAKTSFGECTVDGIVTPQVYHTNMSVTEFKGYGGGSTGATRTLATDVTRWVKGTLGYDLKDFDANEDGCIDSLIMIYTCEPHVKKNGKAVDDDLYWAFCSQTGISSPAAEGEDPVPYRFFWASFYTFYEDGYYDAQGVHHDWTNAQIISGEAQLDAHTLIHEYGHVLSLPDYYCGNYDEIGKVADAYNAIRVDMMAYNVGDHNAFSKALYGWIAPYLAYGTSKIHLNSTTDTGDFVVIPVGEIDEPDREFTLLSQFLMIEVLTPTGVAKADSEDAYAGSYPEWFKQAGVRISLVDARPGRFDYNGAFQGFTAAVSRGNGYYVTFACDNNDIHRSCFTSYKLLEIISSTGVQTKYLSGEESDTDLFHQGDVFNADFSYKAHAKDGKLTANFPFSVSVDALDAKGNATISITKNA